MLIDIEVTQEDIINGRNDIIDTSEFIQVASIDFKKGETFKPHKHILNKKTTTITQESWVVIQGKVQVILYDIDNKIIDKPILKAGDCSITLQGGHNYISLEEGTLVYEYKTGPYYGQQEDREFIN